MTNDEILMTNPIRMTNDEILMTNQCPNDPMTKKGLRASHRFWLRHWSFSTIPWSCLEIRHFQRHPQSLAMCLQTHQNGATALTGDSAGGTPTGAVETTALPWKSPRIEDARSMPKTA